MKQTSEVFGVNSNVSLDSYVDRGQLDGDISKLLARNTHIALRGESKCGKSWLRQNVVPDAIVVQCRLGRSTEDIYIDVLSQLEIGLVVAESKSGTIKGNVQAQGKIGSGLLSKVFGVDLSATASVEGSSSDSTEYEPVGRDINDLRHIAEIVLLSGRRVVVEDFHYLSVEERQKFAFDLKALWDYGVFVMIIGVWSRSNLLIFLNPDLTGRINELSIYWSDEDLSRVVEKGGAVLNLDFDPEFISAAIRDCYSNVGILQTLVLRALDHVGILERQQPTAHINNLDALESGAYEYADQLNALYQQFAERVASGIRKRQDSTGIYAHTMAVVLESDDQSVIKGIHLDEIFEKAKEREPRIHKANMKTILERIEGLQVDSEGRGLVVAYNEATNEVSVVDRQLLLYRKYSTVAWPWEDLVAEGNSGAA